MVEPSKRTRSTKKVKRKTPSGANKTHFRRRKPSKKTCGRCGKHLPGTVSAAPKKLRSMSASSKKPARPYAGVLCTGCVDELMRYVTRMEVKHKAAEQSGLEIQRDLTLEKYLPRGWYSDVTSGKVLKKSAKKKPERSKKSSSSKSEKPKKKAKSKKKTSKKKSAKK